MDVSYGVYFWVYGHWKGFICIEVALERAYWAGDSGASDLCINRSYPYSAMDYVMHSSTLQTLTKTGATFSFS